MSKLRPPAVFSDLRTFKVKIGAAIFFGNNPEENRNPSQMSFVELLQVCQSSFITENLRVTAF